MSESLRNGEAGRKRGVAPRRTVKAQAAYVPPLEGRRGKIRLDFNENTTGFPDVLPELEAEDSTLLLTVYPEYDQLTAALAKAWNVPEECLLLTNGSDEALFVISFTFIEPGQDRALTMRPTFGLIPHNLCLMGAELIEAPYSETLQYDAATIEPILESGVKLAIFASPDNPVGALLPVEQVRRWCAAYPDTLFVIDEAYAEFAEASVLPLLSEFGNLLVTRTFSKAWGLAGLRLGVMLGAPALMDALRRVRSPYSVNTFAAQTALRMLPRLEDVQASARETMRLKARILPEIEKRGYRLTPGAANFFLIDVGPDSAAFCAFFRARGVLLRDQSSRPGLEGKVRVSVGNEAEMARFIAILDEIREKRVLLFDMDGTLVDTRPSFDETVARLVEKYSGKPLVVGELDALRAEGGFNDDWDATVELLRRRGVRKTYEEIAPEAQALYLTLAAATETWLIEPAVLERLRLRYRLGVATGRFRTEFDPVWKTRFEPLFEVVVCQDDGPGWERKPEPRILKEALNAMGAEGGVYIGNSVDDMHAAKSAGLTAIGMTFTQDAATLEAAGADCLFHSPQELQQRLVAITDAEVPRQAAGVRIEANKAGMTL